MKRIVVFSGAGMSAESGIKTFRDSNGLWEEYNIEEVATPEAWKANPELVLKFYNMRRQQVVNAEPNAAHFGISSLEKKYDVLVITQNIDNLHERAGSNNVVHLHGEIMKAKSEFNEHLLVEIEGDLQLGDLAPDGKQLRPHVVWFGEPVPMYPVAAELMKTADLLIIVGTSLNVYPAAGLIYQINPNIPVYLVDPGEIENPGFVNFTAYTENASTGISKLVEHLLVQ